MKKKLNAWQIIFAVNREFQIREAGWKRISIGVIKLTSFPNEGVKLSNKNYKGFLLEWRQWFPWEKVW